MKIKFLKRYHIVMVILFILSALSQLLVYSVKNYVSHFDDRIMSGAIAFSMGSVMLLFPKDLDRDRIEFNRKFFHFDEKEGHTKYIFVMAGAVFLFLGTCILTGLVTV